MKINLLPEAKQVQKKVQKLNILSTTISISIIVLFVVVALIFLGINISGKSRLSNLKNDISSTENELKKYKKLEDTVISLEKGLKSIQEILASEGQWSLFFEELEKSTPIDVQFTKLDIESGQASAELVGKDVNSLARFVESFSRHKVEKNDEKLYSNVNVSGYEKKDNVVEFSATFDITTEALWQ